MPLSAKEAFKVGFLARCAAAGLTPGETLYAVKAAADAFEKRAFLGSLLGKATDAAGGVAKGLAGYAIPAAVIAPPVLGGLGGYALAKATDVDDTDVEAIKNQELIDEYTRQTEDVRRRKAVRDYAAKRARTGRVFI